MAKNNTRSSQVDQDNEAPQVDQDTVSTNTVDNGSADTAEAIDGASKRLEVTFDKATRTIGFDGKNYPVTDMIEAAIDYAIFNGLKQGTKDAIAGLAPAILGKAKNPKANWSDTDLKAECDKFGLVYPNGFTTSVREQLVPLVEAEALRTKFAKIMAGEVSTRASGPRKVGVEKILDDMVVTQLRAIFAASKTALPTGDELEDFKTRLLAHPDVGPDLKARAQAEFERQSANAQTVNLAALMAASGR